MRAFCSTKLQGGLSQGYILGQLCIKYAAARVGLGDQVRRDSILIFGSNVENKEACGFSLQLLEIPSNSLPCSSSPPPSIFLFLPGSLEIHPIKCNLAKSLPSKEVPGIKIRVRQRESKPCKTLLLSRRPRVACLEIMHTTCKGPLEVSPILLCGQMKGLPIVEYHT